MTLKNRLNKAESAAGYVTELARLKTQEAKPLFEVAFALMQSPPGEEWRQMAQVTDQQLVGLLLDTELTPEQRRRYEQVLQGLLPLEAQAQRNLTLPPGKPDETTGMAQGRDTWPEAAKEGYRALGAEIESN